MGPDTDNKETQKQIDIAIRNIGNGFAKTLVINTGTNFGGLAFSKVINVGEETHTFFVLNKENLKNGLPFSIQYIDSMTNEYVQDYIVKAVHDRIEIECEYPQLIEQ